MNRDLIPHTTALALMAAWSVYRGLKHPEQRLADLLIAVVWVLLAINLWVPRPIGSRPIGDQLVSEPSRSFRRTLLVLLVALGLFTFAYVMESREQAAKHRAGVAAVQ